METESEQLLQLQVETFLSEKYTTRHAMDSVSVLVVVKFVYKLAMQRLKRFLQGSKWFLIDQMCTGRYL